MYLEDLWIKRKTIIRCLGVLVFSSIACCAIFRYGSISSNNSDLVTSSNINGIDKSAVSVRIERNVTSAWSLHERNGGNNDTNIFFLVILVMSAPANKERRQVIRQTWASTLPEHVKILFVLGTKFVKYDIKTLSIEEWKTNKDMISLPNLEDNYKQLTIKVIQAMKRIQNKFAFAYLLKVDDDTFVRVRELLSVLQTKPRERLYWGFFLNGSSIFKEGPYAEHKPYMCGDKYVSYALGGGYALSKDLVTYITDNSDILKIYANEDVSVGTWLAPLDVNMVHDERFRMMGDCKENQIVFHHSTINDTVQFNKRLALNNKFCA